MDNEQKTFDKLKQTPLTEMIPLYDAFTPTLFQLSPVYNLGAAIVERSSYYPEIIRHSERINFLKKHGWELEEYCLALEKRALIEQIYLYNLDPGFPKAIIDRAREFFPNIKYEPARITFE